MMAVFVSGIMTSGYRSRFLLLAALIALATGLAAPVSPVSAKENPIKASASRKKESPTPAADPPLPTPQPPAATPLPQNEAETVEMPDFARPIPSDVPWPAVYPTGVPPDPGPSQAVKPAGEACTGCVIRITATPSPTARPTPQVCRLTCPAGRILLSYPCKCFPEASASPPAPNLTLPILSPIRLVIEAIARLFL